MTGTTAPAEDSGTRFWFWLSIFLLIGLAVRLVYIAWLRFPAVPIGGDAVYYSEGANLLARGYGFVQPIGLSYPPAASHPPAYTLWLALASTGGLTTQAAHLVWSAILGTATIAVCGLAGRQIGGARLGLWAAAVAAVYPNLWVHDGMLLSETAAIFAGAVVVWLAYRAIARPSIGRMAALGAGCGLGALARAELASLVVLVALPIALLARDLRWSQRVMRFGVGAVVAILAMSPWVGYNLSRFHRPVYLSNGAGITQAAANCHSTYYGDLLGYKDLNCQFKIEDRVKRPNDDESDLDAKSGQVARKYMRAHLDRLPVVMAARVGRVLGVYRPQDDIHFDIQYFKRAPSVAWSTLYSYYAVAVLAVVGLVMLRRRRIPIYPLVAVPGAIILTATIAFGQLRYRAAAEPSLVIAAAAALHLLTDRRANEPVSTTTS